MSATYFAPKIATNPSAAASAPREATVESRIADFVRRAEAAGFDRNAAHGYAWAVYIETGIPPRSAAEYAEDQRRHAEALAAADALLCDACQGSGVYAETHYACRGTGCHACAGTGTEPAVCDVCDGSGFAGN